MSELEDAMAADEKRKQEALEREKVRGGQAGISTDRQTDRADETAYGMAAPRPTPESNQKPYKPYLPVDNDPKEPTWLKAVRRQSNQNKGLDWPPAYRQKPSGR